MLSQNFLVDLLSFGILRFEELRVDIDTGRTDAPFFPHTVCTLHTKSPVHHIVAHRDICGMADLCRMSASKGGGGEGWLSAMVRFRRVEYFKYWRLVP